jgi:hypothetical protein
MTGPTPEESYDRGHAAGEVAGTVAEQLRRHDDHFRRINGSVDHVAHEIQGLRGELADERQRTRMDIQQIVDLMKANTETVKTTAAALAAAEESRRRAGERNWSPVARALTLVGALVGIIGVWLAYRATR